ncbi:YopX family protein [Paenibacillus polymyxa]|uniref:YopX family protein n=1 Tax=Paenibacillus polymyxa TaxID=1406 RepID=UPI002AB46C2D|nr:YopX family protein [Paenibacillus polymyxa]MDY8046550.1 YopX family protein [Paenibacillus polymyxa]
MSRPIKFRAWNKYNKKWIDRVLAGCNSDGTDYVCNLVWNDEGGDWMHFDEGCGDIVQYTGLKDRNGKEIYEGDILAWQDHKHLWSTADDRFTAKATVKFDLVELKYTVGHLSLSAKREFEVIGNIYETPLEDTP